jgi:phage terminase large subunit
MKGSAGSGKSVNIAQSLVLKLSDKKYKGANLLCVRKIDESNRDSTFAELKKAIFSIFGDKWQNYWSVRESPLKLTCKVTGNSVIFRGMKDDKQREKVKSITSDEGKITWIWVNIIGSNKTPLIHGTP